MTDKQEQNDEEVICPACCAQFRAIPVNVQRLMLDAGFEPPFVAAPPAQPAQPLTLVQATAPREIWLQISDEAEHSAEPFPTDHEGITWCQDSVLTCEVKYVRADLAAQPAEPGHVILSAKARRVLGLTEAPAPRVRNKHEALPPACDLFARPLLTRDDFGTAPPMRLGASDALAVPSRGPFRGGAA